ncbi:g1683 [Coccomyxa elongata]
MGCKARPMHPELGLTLPDGMERKHRHNTELTGNTLTRRKGDDSAPPTVHAPQVAGRTTEPPGREILRGELRGHVWWAARTGGRGQCLGVGGTPHRPCPAVLCGSLDRWYRVTGAPFRAGDGRRPGDQGPLLGAEYECPPSGLG